MWIPIWLAWHSSTGDGVVRLPSELTGMMTPPSRSGHSTWLEVTGVNPEDQKGFQLTEQQGTNQVTEVTVN